MIWFHRVAASSFRRVVRFNVLPSFTTNRNLMVMFVTILVNVTFTFMWNPLLPLHLRSLGASDAQIGVSFTLIGIARTFFAIVGGALADRFGHKTLLTAPHFACAIFYMLAGFTTNWVALVAMMVLANALNALINPAFNAILTDSVPENGAAQAFSAAEAGVLVGLIAGPLTGAALVPYFSIPILISSYGVVLFITTLVRWLGIVDSLHHVQREPTAARMRAAFEPRVFWYIAAFGLVQMAFNICFGPYFTFLANDVWRNSESEINILFALGSAASLVGIPLGQRADRWGTQRVIKLGLVVFALTVVGWGIAPTWQWGVVPLLIAFFFSEAAIIAILAMQAQITTRESRASVMGVIATTAGLIAGLGPALAAVLVPWGGYAAPFIACGVMSLLALVAAGRIQPAAQTSPVEKPAIV